MKDCVVLMYCKDDTLYPVALTKDQHETLQHMAKLFEPLQLLNIPRGNAVELTSVKEDE